MKIRGMRIELGEIELMLSEHPEVREAAVIVEGNSGKPLLVAYVVAREQYATSAAEMGAFLKSRLPVYMAHRPLSLLQRCRGRPMGKSIARLWHRGPSALRNLPRSARLLRAIRWRPVC